MSKVLFILALIIVVAFAFMKRSGPPAKKQGTWNKNYDHVLPPPREYPVFLDAQTTYLDEQIMYGEWDQKISSSL
jgi:hypothetical protein